MSKTDFPGKWLAKCLTINNAIITDIDSRVGSLEPEKDADVVIWGRRTIGNSESGRYRYHRSQIAYRRKAGESNVDYQKL